jgi:molybdopterin/thiamine biosynthesis adenylyltransferase
MGELTDTDKTRYHRQMLIEGWGEEGQRRLKEASVFVAGAGGLGSPVSIYLAVAGVGRIAICDADRVELSNLNRQILHNDARIGARKAASAARALQEMNPTIAIEAHADYLDEESVARIVGQPDVVVDCLGQVTFLAPPETPCLRCIFPEAPPRSIFPVLGATPGIIGTIQAMETLKHLSGVGETLRGTLLIFDGEAMEFMPIRAGRAPGCPDCGHLA